MSNSLRVEEVIHEIQKEKKNQENYHRKRPNFSPTRFRSPKHRVVHWMGKHRRRIGRMRQKSDDRESVLPLVKRGSPMRRRSLRKELKSAEMYLDGLPSPIRLSVELRKNFEISPGQFSPDQDFQNKKDEYDGIHGEVTNRNVGDITDLHGSDYERKGESQQQERNVPIQQKRNTRYFSGAKTASSNQENFDEGNVEDQVAESKSNKNHGSYYPQQNVEKSAFNDLNLCAIKPKQLHELGNEDLCLKENESPMNIKNNQIELPEMEPNINELTLPDSIEDLDISSLLPEFPSFTKEEPVCDYMTISEAKRHVFALLSDLECFVPELKSYTSNPPISDANARRDPIQQPIMYPKYFEKQQVPKVHKVNPIVTQEEKKIFPSKELHARRIKYISSKDPEAPVVINEPESVHLTCIRQSRINDIHSIMVERWKQFEKSNGKLFSYIGRLIAKINQKQNAYITVKSTKTHRARLLQTRLKLGRCDNFLNCSTEIIHDTHSNYQVSMYQSKLANYYALFFVRYLSFLVQLKKERNALVVELLNEDTENILRKYFNQWRKYTLQYQYLWKPKRIVQNSHDFYVKKGFFSLWRTSLHFRALVDEKNQKADNFYRTSTLKKAFGHLKCVYIQQEKNNLGDHIARTWYDFRILSKFFVSWINWCRKKRMLQEKLNFQLWGRQTKSSICFSSISQVLQRVLDSLPLDMYQQLCKKELDLSQRIQMRSYIETGDRSDSSTSSRKVRDRTSSKMLPVVIPTISPKNLTFSKPLIFQPMTTFPNSIGYDDPVLSSLAIKMYEKNLVTRCFQKLRLRWYQTLDMHHADGWYSLMLKKRFMCTWRERNYIQRRKLLQKFFKSWMILTLKRCNDENFRSESYQRKILLQRYFARWRNPILYEKDQLNKILHVQTRVRIRLIKKSLSHWRLLLVKTVDQRVALTFFKQRHIAKCFYLWQKETMKKLLLRRVFTRAMHLYNSLPIYFNIDRKDLLLNIITLWRDQAVKTRIDRQKRKLLAEKQEFADEYWRKSLCRKAFLRWKTLSKQYCIADAFHFQIIKKRTIDMLNLWRIKTIHRETINDASKEEEESLEMSQLKESYYIEKISSIFLLKRYFRLWKQHSFAETIDDSELDPYDFYDICKQQYDAADQYASKKLLQKAIRLWKSFVPISKNQRMLQEKADKFYHEHLQNYRTTVSYERLENLYPDYLPEYFARTVRLVKYRRLLHSFNHWKDFHRRLETHRLQEKRAITWLNHHRLSKAFSYWKLRTQFQNHQRTKMISKQKNKSDLSCARVLFPSEPLLVIAQ